MTTKATTETEKKKDTSAKTTQGKSLRASTRIKDLSNRIACPIFRQVIKAIGWDPGAEITIADLNELKRIITEGKWIDDKNSADLDLIRKWRALYKKHPEKYSYFAVDAAKRLYWYTNGVFLPGEIPAENHIQLSVYEAFDGAVDSTCNSVIKRITTYAPPLWPESALAKSGRYLNLRNGILDIHTRKLIPHTPEFLSSVQLPIKYDPAATCPAIDKFISQVFPSDACGVAYEILAWIIFPELSSIQRCILLYGEGRNGKSAFLNLLTTLIGDENVSAINIHQLEINKHAPMGLIGKLANICDDLPTRHLADSSVFKKTVTHNKIHSENKFKHGVDFYPQAKMLFSANTYPESPDKSDGFFRRFAVIPFNSVFTTGSNAIRGSKLTAMLYQEDELSGMLNRALTVLSDLRERNDFTKAASITQAGYEFRRATDPFAAWLDLNTEIAHGLQVLRSDLYKPYEEDMRKEENEVLSPAIFGKRLLQLKPSVTSKKARLSDGSGRLGGFYFGIGLIPKDVFSDDI